ncbi:TPA: hypothetical protein HA351_10060 [Methanosarcinaceae archaeon]|nr:hypothetical protein [Methanosarcinaceae archaeon]
MSGGIIRQDIFCSEPVDFQERLFAYGFVFRKRVYLLQYIHIILNFLFALLMGKDILSINDRSHFLKRKRVPLNACRVMGLLDQDFSLERFS